MSANKCYIISHKYFPNYLGFMQSVLVFHALHSCDSWNLYKNILDIIIKITVINIFLWDLGFGDGKICSRFFDFVRFSEFQRHLWCCGSFRPPQLELEGQKSKEAKIKGRWNLRGLIYIVYTHVWVTLRHVVMAILCGGQFLCLYLTIVF